MGAATRGALETGGLVQCVTNRMFVDETLYKVGFSNIIITDTMPERKEGLWSKADAFICLPGGLGTLDEIAEIMCRRQLSLHYRPIVFLNTNGFYEFIKSFLRQCVNDKFIARNIDQTVHFADNPVDAVAWLNTYEYVYIDAISMKSKEMENAEKSQIGQ